MRQKAFHHRSSGFTLVELTISVTVLTLLAVFSGRIYLNYLNASRDLKAANLVYEEGRFLMERIVREVRQNAVDYEQFFNQNVAIPYNIASAGITGSYNDNYCAYSQYFYDNGLDDDFSTVEDNESRGYKNPDRVNEILFAGFTPAPPLDADGAPAALRPIEKELYLINISGNKRKILTRVEKTVQGEEIGKVALLEMTGKDYGLDHINGRDSYNGLAPNNLNCKPDTGETDSLIDSWFCATDFPCQHNNLINSTTLTLPPCEGYKDLIVNDPDDPNHSFMDISPNGINVVDLKFMIAPMDDPWKAYNMNSIQIQPHVTIQLTVKANPRVAGVGGIRVPSITLTSTVTSRNYDEIKSDCL